MKETFIIIVIILIFLIMMILHTRCKDAFDEHVLPMVTPRKVAFYGKVYYQPPLDEDDFPSNQIAQFY